MDTVPSSFVPGQVLASGAAGQEEEEALFVLEDEFKQRRRDMVRGVGTGIGAGLLLTGLVVGGFYAYRTHFYFHPVAETPHPVAETPPPPVSTPTQPSGQVMTVEELGLRITGAGAQDPGRALATIREQVETHFPQLQEAYARSLGTDPSLKGSVTLHMTVTPGGGVTYVKATPAGITDAAFIETVRAQAQTWQFPPISAGIASVHYPLLFYPEGTDPKALIAALPAAQPDEPPAPSEQPKVPAGEEGFPRKYRVTYPTSVRDKPTWASKALAELREDRKITVVGIEGDWLKVQPSKPENPPGYVWGKHAEAQ